MSTHPSVITSQSLPATGGVKVIVALLVTDGVVANTVEANIESECQSTPSINCSLISNANKVV